MCLLPSLFPSVLPEVGSVECRGRQDECNHEEAANSIAWSWKIGSVVISLPSFPMLVICVSSFTFLISLTENLSVLWIPSSNQLLVSLTFSISFLFSFSLPLLPTLLFLSFLLWIGFVLLFLVEV